MNASLSTLCYIEKEGKYLMLHRTKKKNDPSKDLWMGVGGHFELGESPDECVVREVREETGIDLTLLINSGQACLHFLFSIPNTYLYSGLTIHSCDAFYHIEIPSDTPFKASDDVATCFWLEPADVDPERFGLTSIREAVRRHVQKAKSEKPQ